MSVAFQFLISGLETNKTFKSDLLATTNCLSNKTLVDLVKYVKYFYNF